MKAYVVEKQKIRHNIAIVKKHAEGTPIFGVVKGDGYGLGLRELALTLREEGISRFAVTEPEEVAALRSFGLVEEDILMLRSTSDPDELAVLVDHNATATIGSLDAALALSGVAQARGQVAEAHIKIDTGMGRYGFLPDETDKMGSVFRNCAGVAVTGVYTHFCRAFDGDSGVRNQMDNFLAAVNRLRLGGLDTGMVHAAGSCALLLCPGTRLDAVRVGSALTGRVLAKGNFGFQPVGHIECRVSEIKWLPSEHTVGYGSCYKTKRPTRIAVLPVGYSDGYTMHKAPDSFRAGEGILMMLGTLKRMLFRRALHVNVGGARCRVLGHVGMLHTVIDVTEIECRPGDVAYIEASPLHCSRLARRYV